MTATVSVAAATTVVTLLSAWGADDETRRQCDAAVAEGVVAAAAAQAATTDADRVLAAMPGQHADDDAVRGVREARERLQRGAWVPRCTERRHLENVISSTRETQREVSALTRALRSVEGGSPR